MSAAFFTNMPPARRRVVLLAIIYVGFISLGLPDNMLGVAWESMRGDFGKPVGHGGAIPVVLTAFSAISAFASGGILRRIGTGKLLAICGFLTGFGLLGYAVSPFFWVLLMCAIPLGLGQGAIDTGMNYYVAKHYTSRDMSWLHCCWGIGASAGPLLLTAVISAGHSWRLGYAVVAAFQISLAAMFTLALDLWADPATNGKVAEGGVVRGKAEHSFRFWSCPAMFFIYCGIEHALGLWGYTFLVECHGFSHEGAGYTVTGYWVMLTAGRFLVGFVANRIGNDRQVRYSMILGVAASVLLLSTTIPPLIVVAMGAIGFALAAFFPAMMHAAPERFDDATAATVIGYQGGAGMVGIALLPAIFGRVAERFSFGLLPYFAALSCLAILLLHAGIAGKGIKRKAA